MKRSICKYISLIMMSILIFVIILPIHAITPAGTAKVARLSGDTLAGENLPNPNQTYTNYKVYGTDLGIMWDNERGEIMIAFGDTFGVGWTGPGAGGSDWRSNDYSLVSINVNTGPNSTIEVYGSMWATGDTWIQFDSMLFLPGGTQEQFVFDGGFEGQRSGSISSSWMLEGNGGVDHDSFQYSGHCNAWLRSSNGWNAVKQIVYLSPNTNYRLSDYIKTSSNNTAGYFGVRYPDGSPNTEQMYGSFTNYSLVTLDFNSGNNTDVTVFAGMWADNGDTWVQLDDISVLRR